MGRERQIDGEMDRQKSDNKVKDREIERKVSIARWREGGDGQIEK